MPPIKKKRPTAPAVDPISVVLYGPSGNGKTSFAANFPRPAFICDTQEKGVNFLSRRNLVPRPVWIEDDYSSSVEMQDGRIRRNVNTWQRLIDRVWDVVRDDKVGTLVLEAAIGIETICFVHHALEQFGGDYSKEGFFAFQSGPIAAATFEWPRLMEAMDGVLESGKHVIMTAHSQIRDEDLPEGVSVHKHMPMVNKYIWERLHRWASAVFFIGRGLERDTKSRSKRRAKTDVFDRLLYTEGTPYCDAKNWLGLEGIINLGDTAKEGYDNFASKMKW